MHLLEMYNFAYLVVVVHFENQKLLEFQMYSHQMHQQPLALEMQRQHSEGNQDLLVLLNIINGI